MRKSILITMAVLLMTGHMVLQAWAEKAYVFNTSKITLRTGPEVGKKIIAMLPQDEPVEILQEDESGWSLVRLLKSSWENKEGWVLSRYLVTRLPLPIQANALTEENSRLKIKLTNSEKGCGESVLQRDKCQEKLQETSKILLDLRTSYETLKKESKGFLKLKEEHETTLADLEEIQKTNGILQKENDAMKASERNRWFLTGALVLLFGFFFGLVMGKQQRKKKSSYY